MAKKEKGSGKMLSPLYVSGKMNGPVGGPTGGVAPKDPMGLVPTKK